MKMQEEGNSGPDPEMGSVASVGAPTSSSWHNCHPAACHSNQCTHGHYSGSGPVQGKRMPANGFNYR